MIREVRRYAWFSNLELTRRIIHAKFLLCVLVLSCFGSLWLTGFGYAGNYVLVEEGDREKAVDAGNKVTGTIVQVLYEEHVRALRKTSFWYAH